MPKRKRVTDMIQNAIDNDNKVDFQNAITIWDLKPRHLKNMNENQIKDWISPFHLLKLKTQNMIYRHIFRYDLVIAMEYFGIPSEHCFTCRFLMAKYNSIKCIQKTFKSGVSYYFFFGCAIQYSNLAVLDFIWGTVSMYFKTSMRKYCLNSFLRTANENKILWAIENGFQCTDINKNVKTEVERQFLLILTKSSSWEKLSSLLSSKTSRFLRMKYDSPNDYLLHTQTEFEIPMEPKMHYSFLFLSIYYKQQYLKLLKGIIGVIGIENIIVAYLIPLQRNQYKSGANNYYLIA